MSFDVELIDVNTKQAVDVENHCEGGTYAIGGTTGAELNITYNYSHYFFEQLDKEKGLRWMHDRTGKECIECLEKAIQILGTSQYNDYWEATPGNAGYALNILLQWAKQYPDAIFQVS